MSDLNAEKEAVCNMPGKARLQCWGCPNYHCPFNEGPFEDLVSTAEVAFNATEKLRTNKVHVLGDEYRSGRELYDELGEQPEGELMARLAESRGEFNRRAGIEGVAVGVLTPDEGSTLARMRDTARGVGRINSREAFEARVVRFSDMGEYVPEEGMQRHTRASTGIAAAHEGTGERNG